MNTAAQSGNAPSRAMLWTGRVLSALVVLMFVPGIIMGVTRNPKALEGMKQFGWSEDGLIITAALMVLCGALYLIPRTAVLGAILMTGYYGGAVATHARLHDPMWVVPVVCGIVTWLALYLRDPRLHELLPLRKL